VIFGVDFKLGLGMQNCGFSFRYSNEISQKWYGRYGAEKHKRPGAARDLATDIADCGLEMHQSKRR